MSSTAVNGTSANGGRRVLDVVGVGFGPSNLGLAIAIEEFNEQRPAAGRITAEFVEAKPRFGWHTGMLIPGTTMQISFLKDLASQRNVQSRYTFLSYVTDRGRLNDFINHQTFFPTRLEFHDYLEWAAERVAATVRYGTRALAVRDEGHCLAIDVEHVETSRRETLLARTVVLAGGLKPHLPRGVTETARQFHNHELLTKIKDVPSTAHDRFVVVGAGQSAAEVTDYLHSTYPDAEVHGVFAKYGYSPADDSPYANRIFDPAAVDDFYAAETSVRQRLIDYHRSTNYSCVDLPLIEDLYTKEYAERVAGRRRLFFRGASEVRQAVESDSGVQVTIEHLPTRSVDVLDCDAVVYATGFIPMPLPDMLGELYDLARFGPDRPELTRDYRLEVSRQISGAIYLQGGTEHTHGLSSSLLSNIAVRSGEIVSSIAEHVGLAERTPELAVGH
ncbi:MULTISPECIES: lysine N(6)-hydroxylase/L-ornithine N(5)-oxygenase family protein [Mycobacteriaceae]|uniref:L-lysine N6-monooxygenase MbtG n=1 Tax=Mycolicibacterium neoaurum VKM Ac-1815D TaxID=700508 RepID=V5XBV2_MYCNE|nr:MULTISPECIES: SidA/IucD/PvdA family monooxygenase [Mycobacteriaceae]AMO05433.1 L-lysine 6-monooxygenase [Mycolicibacterium neoaurum]AXK76249.1 L-lysine 6-monooxygenase [Mycolicibacterium neoaurum]KUM09910.1 L-lysine 6-monooxygenase [Mycolicibacterium neoaurum]